jgi:hypothetical protein
LPTVVFVILPPTIVVLLPPTNSFVVSLIFSAVSVVIAVA